MGATPNSDHVFSQYVVSLIRTKAKQLCRRAGFTRSDEDDIAQDLTLQLLAKVRMYDPHRGASFNTFADRVVNSTAISLWRNRHRTKRAAGYTAASLETTHVMVSGMPTPLKMAIGDADRERRTLSGCQPVDPALPDEIAAILGSLPPELADLARRLQGDRVSTVAREMNASRRWVYAAMKQIRERLTEAGFEAN